MRTARYLIAGCGQMGAGLARALAREGHEVSVIDPDPEELKRLGARFSGESIADSPLDRNVLVQAGIERCDGLAAVFHGDATNVAVAMAARRLFRVPQVVARLDQLRLAQTYNRLGIQTLCPQNWGVNRLIHLLHHSHFEVVASLAGQLDLVEIQLPPGLVGRAVEELAVPQEIQVVLITRAGEAVMAEPTMRFQEGDSLHVMLRGSAIEQLRNMLSLEAS